jgi:hypothetical protein
MTEAISVVGVDDSIVAPPPTTRHGVNPTAHPGAHQPAPVPHRRRVGVTPSNRCHTLQLAFDHTDFPCYVFVVQEDNMTRPRTRSWADRFEAWRPITPELLAASSGAAVEVCRECLYTWYVAAAMCAEQGLILVFDEFVVGLPTPALLEAAHQLRATRRAEANGLFDDEEARWYSEHDDDDDDDDDFYDPPSIADRVVAHMLGGWEGERFAEGDLITREVHRRIRTDTDTDSLFDVIHLCMSLEQMLVTLAGAIRIDEAAVIDARLPGEIADGLRWAA